MRTLRRWALGFLAFVFGAAAVCTPAASLLLLALIGQRAAFPGPSRFWAWWTYLPYLHASRRLAISLAISGGLPVLVACVLTVVTLIRMRPRQLRPARPNEAPVAPVRAASSVHGSANWMPMDEVKKLYSDQNAPWGRIVVGEAYRVDEDTVADVRLNVRDSATWGQGGKAPLLVDSCTADATHVVIVAGSGAYKTTGIYIPTLDPEIGWKGPAVVFDPAGQVGPMVGGLRENFGHIVRTLKPGGDSLDLLSWIDPADPLAELHVATLLSQLFGELGEKAKGDNASFAEGARSLQYCLLLDLLWDPSLPKEKRTLRELRARITTPENEMKFVLETIATHSRSSYARDVARTLMQVTQKTFSGIYTGATTESNWLSIKVLCDLVSGGSGRVFAPGDITRKDMTVFVEISEALNKSTPALARCIVGSIAQAIYLREGQSEKRILFALDEARFLGKLEVLADIRDGGRKHGITMITAWQSIKEMDKVWGEGSWAAWFGGASWRMFAAIDDKQTADIVIHDAGNYTALVTTEGTSTSNQRGGTSGSTSRGRNEGTSLIKVPLVTADTLRTMRRDEAIIFPAGGAPIRCGRAIWFRRKELRDRYGADKYLRSPAPLRAAE